MSGWNASGSGCCQGWWGESQETIRGGICCTKPLRVGQVCQCVEIPPSPLSGHIASLVPGWQGLTHVTQPYQKGYLFGSCICTSVFDLLCLEYIEQRWKGEAGEPGGKKKEKKKEKPHHTHRASPLRNFIMTKGRMEMPFFLIKSLIDETQQPGKPRVWSVS